MASAYTNRANACSDKAISNRALRDYNEAIRIDPGHPFAYYNRGLFTAIMATMSMRLPIIPRRYALSPILAMLTEPE